MKHTRAESSASHRSAVMLVVAFAAALAVPDTLALNPAEKPANYIVAHWDTENGLPHNSIKQLYQTRDGYLWVGTQQGLARFDGISFTNFNRHNTPAFTSNSITSMTETGDGSLWIGTSAELVRYLDGKFTRYTKADGLKSTTINTVCVAPDGSLWIGGRDGVVRWVDGKFVNDIDTSAYDLLGMRNITVDRRNVIWLAIGTGVLRYEDGKFRAYGRDQGLPGQQIQIVTEDSEGRIIAVTQQGLLRLEDDGRFVPLAVNESLSSTRVSRVRVDRAGSLWIGSVAGLDRLSNGTVIPYVDRYGNKLGVVDVVIEGREGGLWVGTSGGLYRFTDRRAHSLSEEEGIPGSLVLSLRQTRDGSTWISTWGAGVTRFQNGVSTRYTVGSPLSHETITCIYEAPDGTMWFGNRGSSIDRLADGKVTTYVLQSGVASNRPVTAMLTDDDGTLLLGIASRGLLQLREGQIVPVPGLETLTTDRHTVHVIYRTTDGRLLIGTTLGMFQRRPDRTWGPVEFPTLKAPLVVRDILEADGTRWLATDGHGLVRWKGREARAYGSRQGVVDDTLFSVLDDGQGALWVSSARGLSRIRKGELAAIDRGAIASLSSVTFGRVDGLLSASTSGNGSPAAIRVADGRLLTATDKGVAVIEPRSLLLNKQSPTVVIEGILVDDEPLPMDREIKLAAGSGKLEIRYTALSLIAPQRLRFRYLLEGSDARWVEAGYNRSAHYTHLAPGRYTFRVLASNSDGVWNETGAVLAVTMLPHYYETLWFRLLAGVLLVSVFASLFWLRIRRLHNRQAELARINTELDQRVEERTAELRRSQECAALEHTRFKFIFDSVPVGITLASERLDGTKLRLINDAHLRICGLTREQVEEPGIFARISHPEDYPRQVVLMRELEEGRTDQFSLEKRYVRPDGQIVWVVMSRLRLAHADGNREYLTTIIDITARKLAERELAATYKNLVEVSRQAGMAEVATGVLHNVGNVLNSLNISASLIATGLRSSKAGSLGQLSDLLAQHRTDLAGFLTTDPKGQRVPEFLASLARHFVEERDRLLAETVSLQQNVDHIKEIVAMQQASSTMVGLSEPLEATSLLEDALKMNAGSLVRHAVRVEREFSPVAPVLAEKAKVIQILINLIRNAQHAAEAGSSIDRVVTLGLAPAPGGRVQFVVRDNGIGIPPENLTRIFAHGFTTKATGHGFGLHSAANAAKEMKGSLTAHSAGPGTGATFVLELPAANLSAAPGGGPAGSAVNSGTTSSRSTGRYTRPEPAASR